MSLFDFFFPEEAQASYLRQIAHTQAYGSTQSRLANSRLDQSISSSAKRIKELEAEVGQMAILMEALLECIEEQGGVTRDQLARKVGEIDMRDGVIDGRITKPEDSTQPQRPKLHIPET